MHDDFKACYTINRKRNIFRIFNVNADYPLNMIQDYKTDHDMTYQQVANALVAMYEADNHKGTIQ